MSLAIPWSFTLGIVDGYSASVKCPIRQPRILVIIVLGDWVLSALMLAEACSTAGVVDLLLHSNGSFCPLSFASDISYLLLWPLYPGFFLWLHRFSTFGAPLLVILSFGFFPYTLVLFNSRGGASKTIQETSCR